MPKNIKNGFKACGIYPFDPEALDYSKCVQNTLETAHKTADSNTTSVTLNDIESAEKVISVLKPDLEESGIDVNVLFNMIRALKNCDTEPEIVSGENIMEAGEYEVAADGVLERVIAESKIIILDNQLLQSAVNVEVEAQPSTSSFQITENDESIDEFGINLDDLSETIEFNKNIEETKNGKENEIELVTNIIEDTTEKDVYDKSKESFENNTKARYKSEVELAFQKHLKFPKPLEKKIKTNRVNYPSAISSIEWRKHYEEKLREKED